MSILNKNVLNKGMFNSFNIFIMKKTPTTTDKKIQIRISVYNILQMIVLLLIFFSYTAQENKGKIFPMKAEFM